MMNSEASSDNTTGSDQSIANDTTNLPNVNGSDELTFSSKPAKENCHVCNVCRKVFIHKSSLVRHSLTHSSKKPFPCSQCDKSFTRSSILKSHLLTHTGERPHACPMCDKRFSQKVTLFTHINTHMAKDGEVSQKSATSAPPNTCDICNKTFSCQSSLTRHRFTHAPVKRYICDVCNKGFNLSASFRAHCGIDGKPFNCELCNVNFNRKCLYMQHCITHGDENLFTCEICYKSFKCKRSYSDHCNLHKEQQKEETKQSDAHAKDSVLLLNGLWENAYICDVCEKTFSSGDDLTLHTQCHMDNEDSITNNLLSGAVGILSEDFYKNDESFSSKGNHSSHLQYQFNNGGVSN